MQTLFNRLSLPLALAGTLLLSAVSPAAAQKVQVEIPENSCPNLEMPDDFVVGAARDLEGSGILFLMGDAEENTVSFFHITPVTAIDTRYYSHEFMIMI